MKIVIYDIPPSNNQFMGKNRSHFEYHAIKEEWHWKVKAAITEKPEKPYAKAEVTITYFFGDARRRDPDNYSGKFILDALTKEGVITDDSFDVITLSLKKGQPDKKRPRTEIEIKEIENSEKQARERT